MNSLVLLVLAASSSPSAEEVGQMLNRTDAFVRVCGWGLEAKEPTDDQMAISGVCVAYATGVSAGRMIASTYEIAGQPVCAQPARAKDILQSALRLYRSSDQYRAMDPAALIMAAHVAEAPCR